MRHAVFDLETNGLLPECTKVHCLVLRDVETNEVLSCTDASKDYPSIQEGLGVLSKAERVYGHNVIGFDLPALRKLYPEWGYQGEIVDTLIAVRHRWAHLKEQDFVRARAGNLPKDMIGSHSLEAWGYRLRSDKGSFGKTTDWQEWSKEMQAYCEIDTLVNRELVLKIRQVGGIAPEALRLDMEVAWYLSQQERNGWPFDFQAAVHLQAKLTQREMDLEQQLVDEYGFWYEPGKEFIPKRDNKTLGYTAGVPTTKVKQVHFNPRSRDHLAKVLQEEHGWVPTEFTPTGKPKVDESTLKALTVPVSDSMAEYLLVQKRLGQLATGKQAWLEKVDHEGPEGGAITGLPHIHHSVGNVTITHRHRHSHPNVAQTPASGVPYGAEMRALWTVPEGWKLLGSDAAGLELRCLAHYMARFDDGAYAHAILEGDKDQGTDIHSLNAAAIGVSRDQAKTFIYAYLYGAGDAKLGSIVDPLAGMLRLKKLGRGLRSTFEAKIPALGKVTAGVKAKAKKSGYVNLIDGRRAYIRSPHAALNTLLQGTGSILCKTWIGTFNMHLMDTFRTPAGGGWLHPWAALGWIHDEVQIAVRSEVAEEVAQIVTAAMPLVGDRFDFRVALEADYAIGKGWHDTH